MTDLIYVDPDIGKTRVLEIATSSQVGTTIYLPKPALALSIRQHLTDEQRDRVTATPSIDHGLDSTLYPLAHGMAWELADLIASPTETPSLISTTQKTRRAIAIWLGDVLVVNLRPALHFRTIAEGRSFDVVSNNTGLTTALKDVVSGASDEARPHKEPFYDARRRLVKVTKPLLEQTYRASDILFCANITDKQYRLASLPVALAAAKRGLSVNFLGLHRRYDFEAQLEFGFFDPETIDKLDFCVPEVRETHADLSSLDGEELAAFNSKIGNWLEGIGRRYGAGVRDLTFFTLQRALARVIGNANSLVAQISPLVDAARMVACEPGRTADSNVAVTLANLAGKPTFEVQSGTISASPRFVKPVAKTVLSIDTYSRNVYVNALGIKAENCLVVGSPKLDYDLKNYRELTREESRLKIGVDSRKLFVLASQPIGVDKMRRIAEIFFSAAAEILDAVFMVKMHPNETDFYSAMYRELASELGIQNFIVSKEIHVLEAIVASDFVFTFYSTVGLEAFALKRPVGVINPFEEPPPYDLVELGLAQMIRDAAELRAFISDHAEGAPPEPRDERDGVLFLGDSADRCAAIFQSALQTGDAG